MMIYCKTPKERNNSKPFMNIGTHYCDTTLITKLTIYFIFLFDFIMRIIKR